MVLRNISSRANMTGRGWNLGPGQVRVFKHPVTGKLRMENTIMVNSHLETSGMQKVKQEWVLASENIPGKTLRGRKWNFLTGIHALLFCYVNSSRGHSFIR